MLEDPQAAVLRKRAKDEADLMKAMKEAQARPVYAIAPSPEGAFELAKSRRGAGAGDLLLKRLRR